MCGNHDPSRTLWMGGIPTIKLRVVYDIVLPTLYEIDSPRTIHATSPKHGHCCLGSWWLKKNTTAESWGHSWRLIKEIVCNSGCASLSRHKSTSFKSRIDTLAQNSHCGLAFEGADLQRLAKKLQVSGLLAGQLSIVVRNGPRKNSLWNWPFHLYEMGLSNGESPSYHGLQIPGPIIIHSPENFGHFGMIPL